VASFTVVSAVMSFYPRAYGERRAYPLEDLFLKQSTVRSTSPHLRPPLSFDPSQNLSLDEQYLLASAYLTSLQRPLPCPPLPADEASLPSPFPASTARPPSLSSPTSTMSPDSLPFSHADLFHDTRM
jgi:hypothetical protein